ncbi:hypothetical protein OUZ56_033377 [Daphnia magna]|uniref:Secreted protein n=1 Tax=Daphnia magna TaxID=35525 RepID=A0ABQ9ZYD3_9CRUS|nr:hypothetical protein OUZ56_033377 [Daphnia magna]
MAASISLLVDTWGIVLTLTLWYSTGKASTLRSKTLADLSCKGMLSSTRGADEANAVKLNPPASRDCLTAMLNLIASSSVSKESIRLSE